MGKMDITPLQDRLPFGVRIRGVMRETLEDQAVRDEVNDAFQKFGMIVFEDVEPTNEMQIALSNVFGPMKEHPVARVTRVDKDNKPGVVEIRHKANEGGVVEIGGKRLSHWLPWHFDHCYNNELNLAGILRATEIAPDGGLTGFADGIALYKAFPKNLLERIEGKDVIYTLNLVYKNNRFGMPKDFVEVIEKPAARAIMADVKSMPRALHPAVWTRKTGEKVLHVSPWMAEGIAGEENPEGDALLEEVCQTINEIAKTQSYYHRWKLTDMLIWDNTRMLHTVTGNDPSFGRTMQRTTIKGDYGLGRFENNGTGGKVLENTY
ncbi:MAG: TauD/TfdA dioxygenase family protein [Rhizomicrobium sp.]